MAIAGSGKRKWGNNIMERVFGASTNSPCFMRSHIQCAFQWSSPHATGGYWLKKNTSEQVECGDKQEHTERKKENEVHTSFRDRASLRSLLSVSTGLLPLSLASCLLAWICVCLSVCVCLCLCFAQWCLLLRLNLLLDVFHFNHGGCYCTECEEFHRGDPISPSVRMHAQTLTQCWPAELGY